MYNILHLTDLHISDLTNDSGEYLRPTFFEKYLRDFCKVVKAKVEKVDALLLLEISFIRDLPVILVTLN
jgi:3',5'-cyclic AMP phosphodiesterase CpdA